MKDEVILYFTGHTFIGSIGSMYPPLSVLPLAGILKKNGYNPRIVDTRLEDIRKVRLDNAICVGISTVTGRRIKVGLEAARYVRENSDVPIIWGGVHPTLLPEQTLQNEYVDIVCRGEGEETLLELVETIERGKSLDEVRGISYKDKNGKIRHNPDRPFMNMDNVIDIDYSFFKNVKAYSPDKTFHYISSRGCPHKCTFCYNSKFCNSTWRTKSVEKIEREIAEIVDKFNPKRLNFLEDNFFVSRKRVEQICDFLIKENFDVEWTADCRANYFERYSPDFMDKMKRSGCCEIIIGAESGSPRILDAIQKDISVPQIRNAVKKCLKHDIDVFALFMIGFPGETLEDVRLTMRLIDELKGLSRDRVRTTISILSPYPGTPIFNTALEHGLHPPTSLEEWGNWNFSSSENTPWFDREYREFLEAVANSARVMDAKFEMSTNPAILAKNLARSLFVTSARVRWKYKYFKFPFEWKVWSYIQRKRGYA
jgi:radical SAM superfamily enzyme YgiQ (UPF0313 family)